MRPEQPRQRALETRLDGRSGQAPCPNAAKAFVRYVDALNYRVGRVAMYLFFVMGAILLSSTASRVFFGVPINWVLEMSQFLLSAYYLLGGAYTMQLGQHVRMDLFYGGLSPRRTGGDRRDHHPVRHLLPRGAAWRRHFEHQLRDRLRAEELLRLEPAALADQGRS